MSDVVFSPESWREAAATFEEERAAFQHYSRWVVYTDQPITADGSNADQNLLNIDDSRLMAWVEAVNNMVDKLNSDASKLDATAANYAASADDAVTIAQRLWEY